MKLRAFVGVAAAVAALSCPAATYTWTGGGDSNFSTAANWGVDSVAFTADDTCVFNNDATISVTMDSAATVGTISFTGAGAVTIGGAATLTVTKVSNASAAAPTFNCPVQFSGGYVVDFATAAANFAGGATATLPSTDSTDNAASHTLVGEIHFTEDWNSPKIANPWLVPSGSKVYGKLVTGTASAVATANTNPSGLIMRVEDGGYAEFDKFIGGETGNRARISVWGRFKAGIWQAGVEGDKNNSHVGFDGDESHNGIIEAEGIHKYSNYNVYLKNPTLYIGAQGLGCKVKDYTFHFNGCPKTIYATADFEVFGPINTGNLVDWGIALDVDTTFDTQGHTITWTGGATGSGALIKRGDGALVMKPHGCNFTKGVTVNGGSLVFANMRGVGSAPITVSSGATLEFSNPDRTTIANAVTAADGATILFHLDGGKLQGRLGPVVPPASGTVKIMIEGDPVLGRVYELTSGANLTAADLAKFSVDGRDDLTFSISSSGDLAFTTEGSSATQGTTFTYAAENADEAVWSTTVAAWTVEGVAGKTPFAADGNAVFQGSINEAAANVTVDEDLAIGNVTINTDNDLTLAGDGTLGGLGKVTKKGSGNLTLDGANFDAQEFEIAEGKVTLGMNAGLYSLGIDSGTGGGKVTVLDGAQFNLNCTNTAGDNANIRLETTQLKTFVIAGAGPDGRGAIVNDALDGRETHNASWSSSFRRIELAADATIGGLDRFDVRGRSGTAATAKGGIFGPGKKLTVKNPGYFGLISLPLDVESVLITDGGVFRPESATISAPGGITLDNGTLHGYATTYPATVPFFVTANGGTLSAENSTTTINGPVTVADGALLTLGGDYTFTFNGAFTSAGNVKTTGGTRNFAGPFTGTVFEQAGGNTYLANGFDAQTDIALTHTSGRFYLKEGSKAKKINVTHTGGSFGFMPGSGTGPQFEEINITSTGGAIDIRPQAAGMMDVQGVINVNQSAGTTYVYGPTNNAEYGLALTMIGSIAQLSLGYTVNNAGDLRLKEGSDLTVKNLHLSTSGASGKGPAHGRIVIAQGAKLAVNGEFHMGRWSQNPAVVSVHTVDVGGEVDASGIITYAAYDSPRSVLYIREGGVFKTKGVWLNHLEHRWGYGSGVGAAEGRHWLVMEGGRFEMGSSGFNGMWTPGVTKVDIQNGDFVNVSGAWGGNHGAPIFFGYEMPGGKVTFDMDKYFVNWNTGLSGASDLTVKGSVNFQGGRPADCLQGAYIGSITVENTGGNDFRNVSCFGGGLKLADGVNAQVAKYSDSRYAYAVAGAMNSGSNAKDYSDNIAATAWSYPFISADFFNYIHTHYDSNLRQSYTCTAGRGEFYVPEDKAGTWTFAGNYDDTIRFDVDGAQVFKSTDWESAGIGTVELAAGWHKFTITAYDATGGVGPAKATWTSGKSLGFATSEITSTDSSQYIKFAPGADMGDGATLEIRPCANVCVWSWQNGNENWNTTENWSHIKCLDSVEYMHRHGNDGTDTTGYFNNKKVNRFQGWFKVEDNQGGEWSFDMHYDDYKMLVIDGVTLINVGSWGDPTNAKVTLTPGWHRWEARVGDNTGGYGPNNNKNNYWTLSYIAPDDPTEKQFIETNLKLAATLGDIAVLEPTGIYKDLELGEGSALTSAGTMAMPIYGTLKGTGTLKGSFAFAGDYNRWEVTGGAANRELARATFENATADTFAGLKAVVAEFDERPKVSTYFLTGAMSDIADGVVEDVAVTVTVGEEDYSGDFYLAVENRCLVLKNSKPSGLMIILQ